MPDCDGIEFIAKTRKAYPELKIIAMSGGGRIGPTCYLSTAEHLGAVYTFQKPIDEKTLVSAIESALGNPSDDKSLGGS
jgi:DNA-binding NtrC family response regulator